MLLKVAFLACWPNISKYVGEHCVDVSNPQKIAEAASSHRNYRKLY